ncbi:hypothetical protein QE411_003000 [Microbacterium arborescens]|nr:hypothetical protein [Microbacterium arborescens]
MADGSTTSLHTSWIFTGLTVGAAVVCVLVALLAGYFAYRTQRTSLWWVAAGAVIAPVSTWATLTSVASVFVYELAM